MDWNIDEEINDIETYIESGALEIRFSNTTFSASFVAHDILTNKNEEPRVSKGTSKIKVSFYLYAIDKAEKKNPNVLVDNKYSREWYNVFKHSLANQWRDAHKIQNLAELRNIRNNLWTNSLTKIILVWKDHIPIPYLGLVYDSFLNVFF